MHEPRYASVFARFEDGDEGKRAAAAAEDEGEGARRADEEDSVFESEVMRAKDA